MWKLPVNFFTLHYTYILLAGLLGSIAILPYGNVPAIDSFFFGISSATESGLNTFDVKDLKTYQQVVIYIVPTITHMAVINIGVIATRLYWFERRLKQVAPNLLRHKRAPPATNHSPFARSSRIEAGISRPGEPASLPSAPTPPALATNAKTNPATTPLQSQMLQVSNNVSNKTDDDEKPQLSPKYTDGPQAAQPASPGPKQRVTFDSALGGHRTDSGTIYNLVQEDAGRRRQIAELQLGHRASGPGDDSTPLPQDEGTLKPATPTISRSSVDFRWRTPDRRLVLQKTTSIEHAASSIFVLGQTRPRSRSRSRSRSRDRSGELAQRPRNTSDSVLHRTYISDLPRLSSQVTIGRNSNFYGMSTEEREILGGIEYRGLKLLLWICIGYFLGLHIIGVICLVPWIQYAPSKYLDYLSEVGQNKIWWAFYSAQTMTNNLGFTLTPDSMIQFRDAPFPMIVMTFLAYTGYNFYPIFLRLLIWTIYKIVPKHSSLREPLVFLLDHPRRCCMLLFPSRPTWILFGILFALNFIDTLLLITLDLNNPSVTELPLGQRILAAIFQAASSRHTGTSTFNLADLNPAAQFSLLVMMYISVYPIALTIRASNTYEERSLGKFIPEQTDPEEEKTNSKYVMAHLRNQLSFDLWYIFLGIFLICIAESNKIMDKSQPEFSVFPVFFEVTSAYGNVGLSLGHPEVQTSLSGQFSVFSKLVICAMMIRGRHRGLPYEVDRAIQLPNERLIDDDGEPDVALSPLLNSNDRQPLQGRETEERDN